MLQTQQILLCPSVQTALRGENCSFQWRITLRHSGSRWSTNGSWAIQNRDCRVRSRPVCPGLWVEMGGGAWGRRGLCLFVSRLAGTKGPISGSTYVALSRSNKWYSNIYLGIANWHETGELVGGLWIFIACRPVWNRRTALSTLGAGAFTTQALRLAARLSG